jgi:capsular polysaccharide biosynthesis protein
VIADLGLDVSPENLSHRIDAANQGGTALIHIAVSAPTAGEAQQTATVLLSEYAATVRRLESVPGSLVPRAELVVVDPPGTGNRVIAWGTPIPIVLVGAALLGFVVGAAAAVIRSVFGSSTDTQLANDDTAGRPASSKCSVGAKGIGRATR